MALERIYRYTPFDIRVSMGLVPGFFGLNMGGRNDDVDQSTSEDLITQGGIYTWPLAAEPLNLVSTDAGDNPAGAGAAEVTIAGLLADFSLEIVTYQLEGLTPVQTTEEFIRVNELICGDAGSAADLTGPNSNLGEITATQDTSGILVSSIPIGIGRAKYAIYTVPAGLGLIIDRFVASIGRAQSATAKIELLSRRPGGTWISQVTHDPHSSGSSDVDIQVEFPFRVPEKTDIRMHGSVSGNNSDLTGGAGGVLFDLDRFERGD